MHDITNKLIEFQLSYCNIVAITDEQDAISEDGLELTFQEGRIYSYQPEYVEGVEKSDMRYEFGFFRTSGKHPNESKFKAAKIIIHGTDEEGRKFKISGDGWIGHDDHGQIEGFCDFPPKIELI